MIDWPAAREALRAPIYAPLASAIARLPSDRWPTHAELTAAAAGITTARGKAVRFIAPRETVESCPAGRQPPDRERRYYELHIADTGEVETRAGNWHDLFNALAWIAYPRAKAMINAQHAAILAERGDAEARHRGPERDALTLFDEGGVAVLSTDEEVFRRIADFEWKALFWDSRGDLQRTTRFAAFGHALFEKALEPHLGMVAKTVFVRVKDPGESADEHLAAHFADRARFQRPKLMAPMPVLGIPGWHPGTGSESFYDDRSHFRPKGRP